MKKSEIQIGKVYAVKVSGAVVPVRVMGESQFGGWDGRNEKTCRGVRIRGAARFRYEMELSGIPARWQRVWQRKNNPTTETIDRLRFEAAQDVCRKGYSPEEAVTFLRIPHDSPIVGELAKWHTEVFSPERK